MTLRQALMIVCIGTFAHGYIHSMAVVEKVFKAISVIQPKPDHQIFELAAIGSHSCCDAHMAYLYKELHKTHRPSHFVAYLFVQSSYEDVSLFLQELTKDTTATILEFDCSKSDSACEQNKRMRQTFKQAYQLYDETKEPVIVYCHNLEGGCMPDRPSALWNFEYDDIDNGDRRIILVSSTETPGWQLLDTFIDRHLGAAVIKDKKVYNLFDYMSFDYRTRKVQIYNAVAHAINAAIIGGVAVSSIIFVLAAYKVCKPVTDPEEN
jgi:hypothetical protein